MTPAAAPITPRIAAAWAAFCLLLMLVGLQERWYAGQALWPWPLFYEASSMLVATAVAAWRWRRSPRARDLLWLQAADNYVELHTAQHMHLLRRTLDGLLADLGPGFVRIHRSRAVALAAVGVVEVAGRGNTTVRLSDGTRLGCSRPWRDALQRALGA